METKKDILWRVYLVFGCMVAFGAAVIFRAGQIQLVQGDYYRAKADSLTTRFKAIAPSRGNIYTADGSLLATSVPVYEIRFDSKASGITNELFNKSIDSLASGLANLFRDKSAADYKRILRQARHEGDRYFLLKRNVSYNQLGQMRKFPVFRLGRYKGGLIVTQENKRTLPFRLLAQRTIGFQVKDVEAVGIEGSFDNYLRGVYGQQLMQKISGNVWKPLDDENVVDPRDGNDVITTLDLNIQDVAEEALRTQLMKHNADKGCAILMEVATGHIKAIANLTRYGENDYREDYNYAIGQGTEPGSTFKLASMLAAMEDGYVDLEDTVDTQGGAINWGAGKPMKDSHEGGYGKISAQRVFEVSSNVGVSKLICKYYSRNPQAFIDHLHRFHLDRPLGVQIAGEAMPLIKNTDSKDWSRVSLPYLSIGYESRLAPIQILSLYNAVANNGRMVRPMLVKEIRDKGMVVKSFKTEVLVDSICSYATLAKARKMLEGVVQHGTATNLKHAAYTIAGKTGTAQIANNNNGYKDGKVKYQASFVGYFPADKPLYSCMVVVYAPSNDVYYGNLVAGPIFKEISDKVYATRIDMHPQLGRNDSLLALGNPIPKAGNARETRRAAVSLDQSYSETADGAHWTKVTYEREKPKLVPVTVVSGLVPDVTGMGLRDALYLLESHGLQVKANGRGSVIRQSIQAGSKFSRGQQIVIELS